MARDYSTRAPAAPARTTRPAAQRPVAQGRAARPAPAPARARSAQPRAAAADKANRFEGIKPVREPFTRGTLIDYIANNLPGEFSERESRALAKSALDSLSRAIVGSVVPRGPGRFSIPGLFVIATKKKAAVKGGQKAINPFTGEPMITKAKPASLVVKIRPAKDLKDIANRR